MKSSGDTFEAQDEHAWKPRAQKTSLSKSKAFLFGVMRSMFPLWLDLPLPLLLLKTFRLNEFKGKILIH